MVICLQQGANDMHYGLVDATTITLSSLAPVKSRMVCFSGAGLPRFSGKRPLNGLVVVVIPVESKRVALHPRLLLQQMLTNFKIISPVN